MSLSRILSLLFVVGEALSVLGQCTNNNTLTGTAVTPNCPGTTNIPCVQGGQYALINVVAGNTYTFSTCGATWDTQITLFNNAGGGSLGFNDDACGLQSTVTWTSNFTGQLRVLIDQYGCLDNTTCAPVVITCVTPPVGDCVYTLTLYDVFSDGWGTSFVGYSIGGGPYQNYTLPFGAASGFVQFGVNIGQVVTLSYNASGTWQTDNSYILTMGGATLFNSGSPPAAGITYGATVTCVTPPPPPEDCLGAVTICSNVSLSNNTNNTGNIADINITNSGCMDVVEFQGTWYVFSPSAAGDLGFSISPLGPDDYDWAVWGPYPPGTNPSMICPPAGPPIRCAASSGPATFESTGSYATGMGDPVFSPPQFASTAVSYGLPSTFDNCPLIAPQRCGWVPGMQVTVGQVYLMYISNWSQSSTGFNLNWILENGASLDCTVLGVGMIDFRATVTGSGVDLRWITSNETNSDHFVVERSHDGTTYLPIGTVEAMGNSAHATTYSLLDRTPFSGMNYYRLRQVDLDGSFTYSKVRTAFITALEGEVRIVPNPGSGLVVIMHPSAEPGSMLVLFDATGRTLQRITLENERTGFDASALPPGVYGYRVISSAGYALAHGTWVRE
ncbi:MAG: T9SS type A sorting domain-containing protein [Flavobacteriales bacterium]|nr:T9SS type A sorting domain-containing protein [Flavobacteriales bacterium]